MKEWKKLLKERIHSISWNIGPIYDALAEPSQQTEDMVDDLYNTLVHELEPIFEELEKNEEKDNRIL